VTGEPEPNAHVAQSMKAKARHGRSRATPTYINTNMLECSWIAYRSWAKNMRSGLDAPPASDMGDECRSAFADPVSPLSASLVDVVSLFCCLHFRPYRAEAKEAGTRKDFSKKYDNRQPVTALA
jgi:hypothetical protein